MGRANQRCPLTDHKAVPLKFASSTKVLGHVLHVDPHTVKAEFEHPMVLRDTAVGRLTLRCYHVECSDPQHVEGHHEGDEPRDQDPEEHAGHQEEPAPSGTARTRFAIPVAG